MSKLKDMDNLNYFVCKTNARRMNVNFMFLEKTKIFVIFSNFKLRCLELVMKKHQKTEIKSETNQMYFHMKFMF